MIESAHCATEGKFDWVQGWLHAKYAGSLTLLRYMTTWQRMRKYFAVKKVEAFDQINRQLCYDYYVWRAGVKRNTASFELRILSVICHEAVNRNIIGANPVVGLGVKQLPSRQKPELSPELMDEIAGIIEGLDGDRTPHKHFYRMSFLIARYHGVRLSETRLPLHWVDFSTNTITFHMKGSKMHTVPMHPKVRAALEELLAAGQAWTFAEPSTPASMARNWEKLLTRTGLKKRVPGICFHCLRVTVISQLARANVSEAKAMRYVAHSNSAVHAIYQRVRVADLADCIDALT